MDSALEQSLERFKHQEQHTANAKKAHGRILNRLGFGRRRALVLGETSKYNQAMLELLEGYADIRELLVFDERGLDWAPDVASDVIEQVGVFLRPYLNKSVHRHRTII